MLDYDLCEMKCADGSALRYEVETRSTNYAVLISSVIKSNPIFEQLFKKLPSRRLLLYFQHIIKNEIYPFIREACVIGSYRRDSKHIPAKENFVGIPESGIFPLLKMCWDFEDIPLRFTKPLYYYYTYQGLIRHTKKTIKKIIAKKDRCSNLPAVSGNGKTIACHYVEGVNYDRRSDLNWYSGSGIEPERVLIYFDRLDSMTGRPVRQEEIQQIEKQGFRWIPLKGNIIENYGNRYWQTSELMEDMLIKKDTVQDTVDKWLINVCNELLKEVHYWRSFYDAFNIRINYIPEEGFEKNIAQAIAFDIDKENPGVLIGKQRSEAFFPSGSWIGKQPKHVFFTWNKRAESYEKPNRDQIETFVIAGYPNNITGRQNSASGRDFCQRLRDNGAEFIIALFDNVHGHIYQLSTKGMAKFYESFLQWVIDEPTLGLTIKSKKPKVIKELPSIHSLLNKALDGGRCIYLENEGGRFPSDASYGADMAIGAGISSALIEAVIGGCRGIHYDFSNYKNHEFYKWGYECIIFDDLGRLISALKRYKDNRNSEIRLGDWSDYIDMLDPFCDGRGGERIGSYMSWLLEGFDMEKSRNEAIHYANRLYAEQWGTDKVVEKIKLV